MCLAIPGKVLAIDASGPLRQGRVAFGAISKEVCLEYVPEAVVGDYVIVHVGFAIARLDEEQAARTLAAFAELGELEESSS